MIASTHERGNPTPSAPGVGVGRRHPRRPARRGISAVLAMMFLILISTLSLGFYASVTTSVAITRNEVRATQARANAESGLLFVRYHMALVQIDDAAPGGTMDKLHADLAGRLNPTANLTAIKSSVTLEGDVVRLPGAGFIPFDGHGDGFSVSIRPLAGSPRLGQRVVARVTGRGGAGENDPRRSIELRFVRQNAKLDYGVATEGQFVLGGSARITGLNADGTANPALADILSTTMSVNPPVSIEGGVLAGDVYAVNPSATINVVSGASVGGTTNLADIKTNHVQTGVTEPQFPTIDTTPFIAYATNTYPSSGPIPSTLVNMRIPAGRGTAITPLKLANKTIRGVLYIEAPNVVSIEGNTTVQGVIVGPTDPTGDVTTNQLQLAGNMTLSGVETLPETFGDLRTLGGSIILMPEFHVQFTGGSGVVGGTVAGGQVSISGNTSLTLTGSIIGLEDRPTSVIGSAQLAFKPNPWPGTASGLTFPTTVKRFRPVVGTYREVGG